MNGELMTEIKNRIKKVRNEMIKENIDAMLISNPKNLFFLTYIDTGKALLTLDNAILWLNELDFNIHKDKNFSPFELKVFEEGVIKRYLENLKLNRIAIENVDIKSFNDLKTELKVELIPSDLLEKVRMIKSDFEIDLLRKSAEIAKHGMKTAYKAVQEGRREIDVVAEIEYEIRNRGSETPPFDEGALLASGFNAARIHAYPTEKKINYGDLVVVDLGAKYRGYFSDMTRTIPVGKISNEAKTAFEFIKELEVKLIEKLEIGMKVSEICKLCEDAFKARGYTLYHSLGHGVGLDFHELPILSSTSDITLQENMVFTIEPGVYVAGKFGVRFEDTIVLKKNKCEIITGGV